MAPLLVFDLWRRYLAHLHQKNNLYAEFDISKAVNFFVNRRPIFSDSGSSNFFLEERDSTLVKIIILLFLFSRFKIVFTTENASLWTTLSDYLKLSDFVTNFLFKFIILQPWNSKSYFNIIRENFTVAN